QLEQEAIRHGMDFRQRIAAQPGAQGQQLRHIVRDQQEGRHRLGLHSFAETVVDFHQMVSSPRSQALCNAAPIISSPPGVGVVPKSASAPQQVPSGIQAATSWRKVKNKQTNSPVRSNKATWPKTSTTAIKLDRAAAAKRRGS